MKAIPSPASVRNALPPLGALVKRFSLRSRSYALAFAAVALCLVSASPAWAGSWGVSYSYDGTSTVVEGTISRSWAWTDLMGPGMNPVAMAGDEGGSGDGGGSATTSGTITATLQWIQDPTVPNDTAPTTVKLVESAGASWSAENWGPPSAHSGSKSVSIGGTVIYEFQGDYGGAVSKGQLVEVQVGASGTITRQCTVNASSLCNGAQYPVDDPWTSPQGYNSTLRTYVSYGVSVHPHPTKFQLAPPERAPFGLNPEIDNVYGVLRFYYEWDSTDGNKGNLGDCDIGEYVDYSGNEGDYHSGRYWPLNPPFSWSIPNPYEFWVSATGDLMADDQDHGNFTVPANTIRSYGYTAVQKYRWRCNACGDQGDFLTGINIVRDFAPVNPSTNHWRYTVSKSGYTAEQDPVSF